MSDAGAQFAMAAAEAVNSISAGYTKRAEERYNATILQNKADLIHAQKDVQEGQDTRRAGQYLSKSMAIVAKNGLEPSGSAMAVIQSTQTQLNIDKAINKFNIQATENYTRAEADSHIRAGKSAVRSGYAGAYSAMLKGAYKMSQSLKPGGGSGGSGFDFSTLAPMLSGGA